MKNKAVKRIRNRGVSETDAMTNYNERLDKLLANLVNQVAANEQRLLNGNATREETIDSDSNATMRAEQAITSLIKELVADAKPGRADTQIWREADPVIADAIERYESAEKTLSRLLEW